MHSNEIWPQISILESKEKGYLSPPRNEEMTYPDLKTQVVNINWMLVIVDIYNLSFICI
jgi:hypothetical protein